jgi:hypothetical protein
MYLNTRLPPHGDVGMDGWSRSPGSRPLHSPSQRTILQWLFECAFRDKLGPLTVAGPRRNHTGFLDGPPVKSIVAVL